MVRNQRDVNDDFVALARLFERLCIEHGYEMADISYQSPNFNGIDSGLRVYAVDKNNLTHIWREGGK
jgi:hypothetical protein